MAARPQVSYPGVYVQEVPSGVRTIVGVSTSVTAFVGWAKSGPVNAPKQLFGFGDYERWFGGLDPNSEMSYAVRQFFLNGGSEAWVVKVAKDASAATTNLGNDDGDPVLSVEALAQGYSGNRITLAVDYDTPSTFEIEIAHTNEKNQAEGAREVFPNLSMNSKSRRYFKEIINNESRLVQAERLHNASGLKPGTSTSGDLATVERLVDAAHNRLQVSVNGSPPVQVELNVVGVEGALDPLEELCDQIQYKVASESTTNPDLDGFTCVADTSDGSHIVMTSGSSEEHSSVRVLAGMGNDASTQLRLGPDNGGSEVDAAAQMRPSEIPGYGMLVSSDLSGLDWAADGPGPGRTRFKISLDGGTAQLVDIGDLAVSDLAEVAERIEAAVQEIQSGDAPYGGFRCAPDPDDGGLLVLWSGTRGKDSSVRISPVDTDPLAQNLALLAGVATIEDGLDIHLAGGNENMFTASESYPIFVGSRSKREGIYALESVDIFNLLCIPGVTDPGVFADADAYCKENRAFLIADAPRSSVSPSDMRATITGTDLPKSEHGAVYYPWIEIADPLQAGRPRVVAPSGTVAGLYARTDSTRGVWKAPAGLDATLAGVRNVTYKLTDRENGALNPLGVNCIRVFPGTGAVGWGARTLRGADQLASEYKYVPVRRVALFMEESLYRGLKWVVFEPNDEPLWAQIRLNVGAFMHDLFRQGAFQGQTPKDAYFVKCDKDTTTQNDINLGIVNIWVGFAPLKPAEFVILYLQQMTGQVET